MFRSSIIAASLLALAVPTAAQAGDPFTIGEGSDPHIVMAPGTDTARAVWADEVADKVHFCAIPRGGTGCSLERVLDMPAGVSNPDRPFVVNGGGAKVWIAMPHYAANKIYLYQSNNGGLNWGNGNQIYNASPGTDEMEPAVNATGTELIFPSANPDRFVASPAVDGSESGTADVANLTEGGVADLQELQVARLEGTGLVALAHNGTNAYFWRLNSGNPSLSANWPGSPTLIGDGMDARLTGADGAPWMMATAGPTNAKRVEVRHWNGAAFGAPTVLANEQGYINDISANGASVVGAIWRKNEPGDNRLKLGLSTNGGASWGTSTIAFEDVTMASMDLALAGDGKGFAIYEGTSTPSSGAKRFIRVASTDTVPEPATTTPTTTTTAPTTTTPGTPTAPVNPTPKTTPLPLVRTIASTVRGATLTLGLPTRCIPAGQPFVATLTWKKQRRKGNLFVKVNRADFFIGSARVKTDRKAPFRQTLRIPNPKKGQSYKFRARAFIKVRRGKAPKKSIFATLKVCG